MTDLSLTIAPKSDQLNADDLIGGARTIQITRVSACPGSAEQPIAVYFEGDNGKPYKPCKSMRRVLVQTWGKDGTQYAGRSMTLYRDPKVQFGGLEVGGIRISHMSHIANAVTMALTATRANKKAFTVYPLEVVTNKRQTASEWIASVNADLEAATTSDEVAAIVARDDVRAAMEKLKPASLEVLKQRIAVAEARVVTPSTAATDEEDIFPGDLPSQAAA